MERKLLEEKLRNYLCAYWLRPETAVWRVCDWLAIKDFNLEAPMLDLACGDGINSYILMGGTLPLEIDDSFSVKKVTPEEYFSGIDIYNDSDSKRMVVDIVINPPPRVFDIGLDWKQNLIEKAKLMKTHKKFVVHDMNYPLPLPNNSFKTVFSNSIYWAKDANHLLGEINRILEPEGRLIAILATDNFTKFKIYNEFLRTGNPLFKYLDRGRFIQHPQVLNEDEWKKLFIQAHFKINKLTRHISKRLAQLHEVGLRPIAPPLIRMANSLPPEKRKEIKEEWIDYLTYLILPIFDGWINDPSQEQCYIAVELIKKSSNN